MHQPWMTSFLQANLSWLLLSFAILFVFFFFSPPASPMIATRHAAPGDCLSPESAATVSKPRLASHFVVAESTSHESAWREITGEKGTVDTLWDKQKERERERKREKGR